MQNKYLYWVYWGAATAMLAMVAHLAIVLFLPIVKTGRHIQTFDVTSDIAQLEQISNEGAGETLIAMRNPDMSYAFCRFDLTANPLRISARFPDNYWSIAVYNELGDNVYLLNDRQAGDSRVKLVLLDGSNNLEQAAAAIAADEKTIIVPSPTRQGVVVFRAFVETESEREIVEQIMANSSCESG